jgi:hypothetical protein
MVNNFRTFTAWFMLISLTLFILRPVRAQWGLGKNRGGGGSTFEELQELAKKQLKDKSKKPNARTKVSDEETAEEWTRVLKEALQDPATAKYMERMNQDMESVLEQLSNLTPQQLQEQIAQGLQQITEPAILENILDQKDEVLSTLVQQGLVTADKADEYRRNPELFEQEIASAFTEMKKIFSDPDAINSAMQMMGLADFMQEGAGASDTMKKFTKSMEMLSDALSDDETIEQARLQLLQDPTTVGNPAIASLLNDAEMQSVLRDPVKWREQVKKGQRMLMAETEKDEL